MAISPDLAARAYQQGAGRGKLQVRWVIAPGFADDQEKFDLTVRLAIVMFPYLMFMSLTAMLSGMLNSLHHFFAIEIPLIIFIVHR